jgi:hypothetical protein
LKMVGECFPWTAANSSSSSSSSSSSASSFVYTQANHKSVLGIGAYAKRAGEGLCLENITLLERDIIVIQLTCFWQEGQNTHKHTQKRVKATPKPYVVERHQR